MYQRILVPLDGSSLSEQVLPYVRALGQGLRAPVELFRVVDLEREFYYPDPSHYQERAQAHAQMRSRARESLDQIAASLQSAGINASAVMHEGDPESHGGDPSAHVLEDPASHIIAEAGRQPDTLIVMCTHGRSGLGRWVMGSVTDKVLHGTGSPMLVVQASSHEGLPPEVKLDSAIIPLDGSGQAEQVLPHAVSLARALGLKVQLVQVTHSDESESAAVEYLTRMSDQVRQKGVGTAEQRVFRGDPAGTIVDLAHQTPGALVAMTHGRSGVTHWLGSVTDRVVRHSGAPVLVVRAARMP